MNHLDPWQTTTSEALNSKSFDQTREQEIDLQGLSLDAPSQQQLISRLCQQASTNDSLAMRDTLHQCHMHYQHIQLLDQNDEKGSPALCYAACFGSMECVTLLLDNGANINVTDIQGWTPYIWARNNGHEQVALFLKQSGANTDLEPVVSSLQPDRALNDFYSQGFDADALDQQLTSALTSDKQSYMNDTFQSQQDATDEDIEAIQQDPQSAASSIDFNYDECLPSEMLVVDERQCELVVKALVDDFQLPHITRSPLSTKHQAAVTMFLCARYAHYFASSSLLQLLMNTFLSKFRFKLGSSDNSRNMTFIAYWLANFSLLLFYMRRDSGLLQSTIDYQAEVSELIQTLYHTFVIESRQRLLKIAVDSINYDSIKTYSGSFEKRKVSKKVLNGSIPPVSGLISRFRSNSNLEDTDEPPHSTTQVKPTARSKLSELFSPAKPAPPKVSSPRTLLTHLASTMFLLQQYHVHPLYQRQLLQQLIYSVGAEYLNSFLDGRLQCSRSKAVVVRFNLSIVEEWLRFRCLSSVDEVPSMKKQQFDVKSAVDSLLKPIRFTSSIDRLLSPLIPSIVLCQVLQTVSGAFNEEILAKDSDDQVLLNFKALVVNKELKLPELFQSADESSGMMLSYEQLKRAVFDNYFYEKEEQTISGRLLSLLDEQISVELKIRSQELIIAKTQLQDDLIFFDAPVLPKSPRKRRPLLIDALDMLPFKLQQIYTSSLSQVTSPTAMEFSQQWGDKNDVLQNRQRHERQHKTERDDELWWLSVKVEAPERISKMLNSDSKY